LTTLLTNLVNGFRVRSDADISLTTSGDATGLQHDVKVALYRLAQEALNNVIKHAEARRVEISLSCEYDSCRLRIADDGKGFELQAVKFDHLGLKMMRERADAAGLTLEIQSQHDVGTEINIFWDKTVYE
jgi:signal transduction histidine kinase